jgi:hypothetical protein
MKLFNGLLIFIVLFILPGCSVIEGIFKAGVWIGILAVVAIAVLIFWLVSRSKK